MSIGLCLHGITHISHLEISDGLRDSSRASLAASLHKLRKGDSPGGDTSRVVAILGIAPGRWGVDFEEPSTVDLSAE